MLELGQEQDVDMPYAYSENDDWFQLGGAGDDDGWEDVQPVGVHTFPPGEEGVLQSHASSEAIMHQIMEGMRAGYAPIFTDISLLSHCRRGDPRTRSYRIQRQIDSWQSQLPLLVESYLRFKNVGPEEIEGIWPINCLGLDGAFFIIHVVAPFLHISESGPRLFAHAEGVSRSNETLLRQGFIGGSPERPAIAFSIRTFEIYRQIHRVCPRYTIDSLAKTLNYLHKVSMVRLRVY
jgi:hypothetical protein